MNAVVITLFEKQIIRNYTSDDWDLFKRLSSDRFLILVTSKSNFRYLSELVSEAGLRNIFVIEFNPIRYSFIFRIITSFSKWSIKCDTTLREIYRLSANSKKLDFRSFYREFLYNYDVPVLPLINYLKKIYLVGKIFKTYCQDLESKFNYINAPKIDAYFITSLTNSLDIQIGFYALKSQVKTIGTVRSWDNLSSHGRLIFCPTIFYSHSDFMTDTLLRFHNPVKSEIKTLCPPNYRFNFLSSRDQMVDRKRILKVGYGCMGQATNPDELNFLSKFNELAETFPEVSFSIIQHPAFPHDIKFVLASNVKIVQFDYDASVLPDFYSNLCSFDLILLGGTSLLLDCAFVGTPTVFIGFEIVDQYFWSSALRYIDKIYHSRLYIKLSGITILRDLVSLSNYVNSLKSKSEFLKFDKSYFLGKAGINTNLELIKLIESIKFPH